GGGVLVPGPAAELVADRGQVPDQVRLAAQQAQRQGSVAVVGQVLVAQQLSVGQRGPAATVLLPGGQGAGVLGGGEAQLDVRAQRAHRAGAAGDGLGGLGVRVGALGGQRLGGAGRVGRHLL